MLEFNLTNHFLIAMPAMTDPFFAKSLTYVCEHNDQGAMGIVVNRPISLTLSELFAQINMPLKPTELEDVLVHFGGPVQTDRGFVLHDEGGPWQSTLHVNDKIGLTTSKDILQAVGEGQGPRHLLVTLGYAGWSEGQLEQELADNAWLSVPASEHILFDLPPEERLPAAMALLGIDYATLSDEAGHA
ncbi:MAG: YqgE/AlgH family protein [Gammaproteobacteria bacterium]|nr:YqgE/AlgH family protein [Gammaproteobacteria bacterium]MBU1482463.1 YqgE/AlgH family protein [Gammaproteobacteria bacterium]